jgi:YHS domain-containing protein
MTGSRRQRIRAWPAAALAGLILALVGGLARPAMVTAATTERVVTDRHSGLAINGFDPVAYFTDAEPKQGREEHEYRSDGVTWRFRNEGNRAAFVANPEVYTPRFGGYDPIAVARGVGVPGHPSVWRVYGGRLYLFFDPGALTAFGADPEGAIAAAEARWPDVRHSLNP